jgi:hypothetical protein
MTVATLDSESVPALRRRRPTDEVLVALAVALVAFATYWWQLSVPEQLSFYDSGVYLAAAVHLVSGVLPYRDFTFVQPPGLLYLLSPLALYSRVFGTHDGLTLARLLMSAVAATDCAFAALLVRPHGRVAMAVAGTAVAVSPVTLLVSSAVKLEPPCLFFVLGGALLVLGRGQVAALSRRRAAWAGVVLGVAGLVKLWAFFPFVAIVAVVALRARNRVLALVLGAGAAFLAGVAPFLIVAPSPFIRGVFIEQLGRRANAADSGTLLWRLRAMTGYLNTLIAPSGRTAVIAFAIFAVLVVVAYRRWRQLTDGDLLVLGCAIAVVVMLLTSPETYSYYDYFAQPFLFALAVIALWRVGSSLLRRVPAPRVSAPTRRFVVSAGLSCLVLVVGSMVLYTTSFYSAYAYVYGYYGRWMDAVTRVVPKGACVVYNEVAYGIYANRFLSSDPNCPTVVDVYGEWMGNGYQLVAPPRSFSTQWQRYFAHAQYAVFSAGKPGDIPWDPALNRWFAHHYRRVFDYGFTVIYRHTGAR